MRRATLILNPAAGSAARFSVRWEQVTARLAASGYSLNTWTITAEPGSGQRLAIQALQTSDLILAAGGDGTLHDVVQGVAGSDVPLGILPLGTANALARNLRLPLDLLAALDRLLTAEPTPIPLGQAETPASTCFFITMAGCGPDGALVATLPAALKARFGRTAYYAHAARLFLGRSWPAFPVRYRLAGETLWNTARAVSVLAARVPDLGGLCARLTAAASLTAPSLSVYLQRAPAQLSLPAWFIAGRVGLSSPWLGRLDVDELIAESPAHSLVHAQADAEPLGMLPLRLSLAPVTVRLLIPLPSGHAQAAGAQDESSRS